MLCVVARLACPRRRLTAISKARRIVLARDSETKYGSQESSSSTSQYKMVLTWLFFDPHLILDLVIQGRKQAYISR